MSDLEDKNKFEVDDDPSVAHGAAKFSFFRVFVMTLIMGVSSLVVGRIIPKSQHETENLQAPRADSSQVSQPSPEVAEYQSQQTSKVTSSINSAPPGGSVISKEGQLEGLSEGRLNLFYHSSYPKLVYHKDRKRAFVGSAVANVREKPAGRLIGQLINGDEVSILDFDKPSKFVKISTSFGVAGYVSIDLLSGERVRTAFDIPDQRLPTFDSFALDTYSNQASEEFLVEYKNFQSLLKNLSTKKSFDFRKSNLRYMIVSSSAIIFPGHPGEALNLIRSVSQKPAMFFERPRKENLGPLDQELEIRTNIPVRRILENEPSKSTRFEKLIISRGCPRRRLAAITEDGTRSQLELLVFDIKKNMKASLSSKPHRGNPSFTWAHADLNGDTWADVALYFGGETAQSAFKYLFIAHNIDGRWQMHRIEDRSGTDDICTKGI